MLEEREKEKKEQYNAGIEMFSVQNMRKKELED